jgi:LPPG:FO 2-phospho-L-lactate transferase
LLVEMGFRSDQASIATLYREVAATLVIDTVDAHEAAAVAAVGVRPVVTDTVMSDIAKAEHVAGRVLAQVATE